MTSFLIIGCAVVFVIWSFKNHENKSRAIVEKWAADQGYWLLSAEFRWFRLGPYTLRANKQQAVFRITTRDTQGRRRSGWIRVGHWWRGLGSNEIDVKWDKT